MARPYKKRAKKPSDFKICDLNKLKTQCLCNVDNVCVCAKLKGICVSSSAEQASNVLSTSDSAKPNIEGNLTNGFASLQR